MKSREIKFGYHYLTEGAGSESSYRREIDGMSFNDKGGISAVLIDGEAWPVNDPLEPNESGVIVEFTGLKDKNGKEIYEGDVVLHKKGDHHRRGPVEMGEGGWTVDYTNSVRSALRSQYHVVEVIGSIYENPELIQQ